MKEVYYVGFVLGLLATLGCASIVEPHITQGAAMPLDRDRPFFVVSPEQGKRVVEALSKADFKTAESYENSVYYLSVKIGQRRSVQSCGTVNNVRFEIKYMGEHIMTMRGRGATGTCTPNIFDEMTQLMKEHTKS